MVFADLPIHFYIPSGVGNSICATYGQKLIESHLLSLFSLVYRIRDVRQSKSIFIHQTQFSETDVIPLAGVVRFLFYLQLVAFYFFGSVSHVLWQHDQVKFCAQYSNAGMFNQIFE